MSPAEILAEVQQNFASGARRRFLPGLLISFIRFLRRLDAVGGRYESLEEFFSCFPQVTENAQGRKNTLVVTTPSGKTLSIRPFYNQIENWFRADQKRFDYPSAAPHATQAWGDYRHWLAALLHFDEATLSALEASAQDFVLKALPSQAIDPSTITKAPPVFLRFLDGFDFVAPKGEPTGAAFQGAVFGYLRADSPHLQVEVGKVRTGSKREKRVGDVDARDADNLILSAEVKQFKFGTADLPKIAEFGKLISDHKATGLVVALDFEEGVRDQIRALGLEPVSRNDLIERVRLWDPLKQRSAVSALLYYAGFREKNSVLQIRIRAYIASIDAPETQMPGLAPRLKLPRIRKRRNKAN